MSISESGFVPMYDLADLNEDQRKKYYRDACASLGVPDNLNLLAFIDMVPEDGSKPRKVLYAKKGATDIIRRNLGISTIELTKDSVEITGLISYLAVGKDANGRIERAVGSISIEGLSGKKLASAVMTAQTRALRRMTLQFTGGGVLDETELEPGQLTTASGASIGLDAIQTQPTVAPSNEIGRDITPTEAQKAAQVALAAMKPETLAAAVGEHHATVADLAKTLPADNPLAQVVVQPEAQKQRKRKPANEVTLDTPAQEVANVAVNKAVDTINNPSSAPVAVQEAIATAIAATAGANVPALPKSSIADIPQSQPSATLPAQPVQPAPVQKLLNEAEEKEVRERLAKYRNEILPGKPPAGGGMVPTEGIGGVEIKLRSFVSKFNVDKPSSKTWNYSDWKFFLDFLDTTVLSLGATGLVNVIDRAIGAKK